MIFALCAFVCSVRDTVIEVEYPLIESQLKDIDQQLEKALTSLNWTSEGKHILVNLSIRSSCMYYHTHVGVWEYIEATRDQVRDLEHCVRLAKANVECIKSTMDCWCGTPLYSRKEDKKDTMLHLEVSGDFNVSEIISDCLVFCLCFRIVKLTARHAMTR